MPSTATCSCGELLALAPGQGTVACPTCGRLHQRPPSLDPNAHTSLLALFSAVLALVGAFTIVGSTLAVLLGLVALVAIAWRRGKVVGSGFAWFGIVVGAICTAGTCSVLRYGDLLSQGGYLHSYLLGNQIEMSRSPMLVDEEHDCALTLPSPDWGRARKDKIDDMVVSELLDKPDLLLVQPARYLFFEVRMALDDVSLDLCQEEVLSFLRAGHREMQLGQRNVKATIREVKKLNSVPGIERREMLVDVRYGHQPWTFLFRLCRTSDGRLYVLRAYTQSRRFASAEAELRQLLDSFQLIDL